LTSSCSSHDLRLFKPKLPTQTAPSNHKGDIHVLSHTFLTGERVEESAKLLDWKNIAVIKKYLFVMFLKPQTSNAFMFL